MHSLKHLYDHIHLHHDAQKISLIQEHGITQQELDALVKDAQPDGGVLPNYIPQLEHIEHPAETIIIVRDSTGATLHHGNTKKIVSAQSVAKILLYAYALESGAKRYDIAGAEAVGLPFNDDPVTHGKTSTAAHPLNNAGGISSAHEVKKREEFLHFVRNICKNSSIDILEDIYTSEKAHRQNNLKLTAALAAAGRLPTDKIDDTLDTYTKACSLGVHSEDLLELGTILMLGGITQEGDRVLQHNTVVRVINAMNSFGLYDATGRMGLMHSGTRSLAAKSSVSGLVLFVNPSAGTYVTLGHHLDRQGNSAFGMQISAVMNELLSHGGAMRLDMRGRQDMMQHYIDDLTLFTQEQAMHRLRTDSFCRTSFVLSQASIDEMTTRLSEEQRLIAQGLASCHIDGHSHQSH